MKNSLINSYGGVLFYNQILFVLRQLCNCSRRDVTPISHSRVFILLRLTLALTPSRVVLRLYLTLSPLLCSILRCPSSNSRLTQVPRGTSHMCNYVLTHVPPLHAHTFIYVMIFRHHNFII